MFSFSGLPPPAQILCEVRFGRRPGDAFAKERRAPTVMIVTDPGITKLGHAQRHPGRALPKPALPFGNLPPTARSGQIRQNSVVMAAMK